MASATRACSRTRSLAARPPRTPSCTVVWTKRWRPGPPSGSTKPSLPAWPSRSRQSSGGRSTTVASTCRSKVRPMTAAARRSSAHWEESVEGPVMTGSSGERRRDAPVHHDPRRSISYRNLDTSAGAPVATRGCPTSHLIGRRILRGPRSTRMRSVPGGRLAPGRGAAGNLTRRLVGSLQGCLHPPGLTHRASGGCRKPLLPALPRWSRTVHSPLLADAGPSPVERSAGFRGTARRQRPPPCGPFDRLELQGNHPRLSDSDSREVARADAGSRPTGVRDRRLRSGRGALGHNRGVVVDDQPHAVDPLVDEGVAGRHLLRHTVLGQRERVEAGVDGVVPVEDRDDLLGDYGLRLARQEVCE